MPESNLIESEPARFLQIGRVPRQVDPEAVVVAEIHRADQPQVSAPQNLSPGNLRAPARRFGLSVFPDQCDLSRIDRCVLLGAVAVVPYPNYRPQRADQSEDVKDA